jgi:hypothetical protein
MTPYRPVQPSEVTASPYNRRGTPVELTYHNREHSISTTVSRTTVSRTTVSHMSNKIQDIRKF